MSNSYPLSVISPEQRPTSAPLNENSFGLHTMRNSRTAQSQQFCLRWNKYQTNLTNVFDQLLQNESFVDVTLACDGQSIKAHKMVLSACSPYFQSLFFDNPYQNPIIIMRDVKWPELKAIVEFMYKGEINVSEDQIRPLLKVAEMLKIRGLADITSEPEFGSQTSATATKKSSEIATTTTQSTESVTTMTTSTNNETVQAATITKKRQSDVFTTSNSNVQPMTRRRKRRRSSVENSMTKCSESSEKGVSGEDVNMGYVNNETSDDDESTIRASAYPNNEITSPVNSANESSQIPSDTINDDNVLQAFPISSPLESLGLSSLGMTHNDDMEIKLDLAESLNVGERLKYISQSQDRHGTSTSDIEWKSWKQIPDNTSTRNRERGPTKSWRPETMAEALQCVLKEGLSLSKAAKKYDIPYPTFVLYATRVHNLLGPSTDGETGNRPKGRGRPQRILLGIWPDEHIEDVIKLVVFRGIKADADSFSYDEHSTSFSFQDEN